MNKQFAAALLLLVTTNTAVAQAGNEVVFVGSSTSGSMDQHAFAESGTGLLLSAQGSTFTDNVSDAVWTNTGRTLYAGQTLQNRVSVGSWNGVAMSWSSLYATTGACYGLGLDAGRKRLWTLVSSTTATELHCVNVDPASLGYGTLVAQTTTLSGPIRERWALAPSGNFAVVPYGTINSGPFQIVDTDPASPTFLQVVVSAPMPAAISAGFAFAFDCKVSLDELYCYVLYSGFGFSSLAVFNRATNAFVDFQPNVIGQQDLALGVVAANSLAVSPDRSFALVSGNGAPGRVLRVNLNYVAPANSTITTFSLLQIPNANAVSLSPDGLRGAVTSTAQTVGGPGKLVFFDAVSGQETSTVQLGNMWNLYTTAWQDASPNGVFANFGVGCSGTIGAPFVSGNRPRIGANFTVDAGNLPLSFGLMAFGFSNMATGGLPLPLSLTGLGMTGCSLLVDPAATVSISGSAGVASYMLAIPNDPLLFGFKLYCQAFALDLLANPFGFTASNGGEATIGL
ncbi:MAG: hypothetical protein FJ301_03315 [Planctomycetes bacterium]|nr:hypothetical protein [Planctomycetota bacterium]